MEDEGITEEEYKQKYFPPRDGGSALPVANSTPTILPRLMDRPHAHPPDEVREEGHGSPPPQGEAHGSTPPAAAEEGSVEAGGPANIRARARRGTAARPRSG